MKLIEIRSPDIVHTDVIPKTAGDLAPSAFKLVQSARFFGTASMEVHLKGLQLTSLKGCPGTIQGSLNCSNNLLTSFEGAPKIIKGDVRASMNKFTNLKNIHNHIHRMSGELDISGISHIKSNVLGVLLIDGCTGVKYGFGEWVKIINNALGKISINGNKRMVLYECQDQLIEADLDQYALI